MFKITDANYEYYKKIYEVLWIFESILKGIDPNVEYSPIILLSSWEKTNKSLARRGLKEGLRDMLTSLLDLPDNQKEALTKQLKLQELPDFSQLTSLIKNTPQKVLKRGKMKSMDEYYVIKEFLNDQTSDISETDRTQLEKISYDFEQKKENVS